MQNRIDQTFADLRARNRAGFIAYLTAGDPSPARTVPICLALESAGVDLIELGLPFSDPLADGPVNQAAATRALAAGTTPRATLDCVRELRARSNIPVVIYTYLNPLYTIGFERFAADAADAGVDGLLVLDLPPDEDALNPEFRWNPRLRRIRLLAPTTPPDRMRVLAAGSEGFVYYVSREGVTGEQSSVAAGLAGRVAEIRALTKTPVAVGFGISTPAQAAEVAACADAVVVGSAIVRRIAEHANDPNLPELIADFARPIAQAIADARKA